MEQQKKAGIQIHLQKLLNSICSYQFGQENKPMKINLPSAHVLTQIVKLDAILKNKKQEISKTLRLQQKLERFSNNNMHKIITRDDIQTLNHLKGELKQNSDILKISKICREIDMAIVSFEDLSLQMVQESDMISDKRIHEIQSNFTAKLTKKNTIFKQIYWLICQFDDEINSVICENDNSQKQFDELQVSNDQKFGQSLLQLRNKYLKNLLQKLEQSFVSCFYRNKHSHHSNNHTNSIKTNIQLLQQSLNYFELPSRPNNRKSNKNNKNSDQEANKNYQYYHIITQSMFNEYCFYCSKKKIQLILDEEQLISGQKVENKFEQIKSYNFSVALQNKISPFFYILWHKILKSVDYIFINHSEKYESDFNAENRGYQIDEPGWMFEYVDTAFKDNLEVISNEILFFKARKQVEENDQNQGLFEENMISFRDDGRNEIIEAIKTYFLSSNIENFFMECISHRLITDIRALISSRKLIISNKNSQSASKIPNRSSRNQNQLKQRKYICFIFFNFLDELYSFQQKLSFRYDMQINFIEVALKLLSSSNIEDIPQYYIDILEYSFEYEDQWIQEKIFSEFYNINYSNITNLRNIESYNITVNFIQLFEKLYAKFKKVQDTKLKNRINQFYAETILRLVRHIKSSFERIYNYNGSGLDKFEILMGFKKVEEQFKGYFEGFLKQMPDFQSKIIEEYYTVTQQYCNVYSLEELNNTHKKIYKKLTQFNELFISDAGSKLSPSDKTKKIQKFNKIYEEWADKMTKIQKICDGSYSKSQQKLGATHTFVDQKLKNIFFVYLESTEFVYAGYELFMEIFEPFLVHIYSRQNYKSIKMMIQMDKGTFRQYQKSHSSSISFITGNQLKSIERSEIK